MKRMCKFGCRRDIRYCISCIALIALAIAFASVFGYAMPAGEHAVDSANANAVWSSAPVSQSIYVRGAEFTVPERTVNIDGVDVRASAVLIFPTAMQRAPIK